MVWQGGFVFYAGVVVPIGTEELQSALVQGLITRRVTQWLNAFGVIWHLLLAWDVLRSPGQPGRRLTARLAGLSALAMIGLILIHPKLDAQIDRNTLSIPDRERFALWHIAYLWLSTMQWLLALVVNTIWWVKRNFK
jgi:hypothetical protein